MFTLSMIDRKGNKLTWGDLVKISDGRNWNFYAEVKYLEKEQCITPFSTFSFHSVEKVDKIPDNAIKSTEERYNIWYMSSEAEQDYDAKQFEHYLMGWRACEHLFEKQVFVIEKLNIKPQLTIF